MNMKGALHNFSEYRVKVEKEDGGTIAQNHTYDQEQINMDKSV